MPIAQQPVEERPYTRRGRRMDQPGADALYVIAKAPQLKVLHKEPCDLQIKQGTKFYVTFNFPEFDQLLTPLRQSEDFNPTTDQLYFLEPYGDFELSYEPGQSQLLQSSSSGAMVWLDADS